MSPLNFSANNLGIRLQGARNGSLQNIISHLFLGMSRKDTRY